MSLLKFLRPKKQAVVAPVPEYCDLDISGPAALIDERFRWRKVVERHYRKGGYAILVGGAETYLGQKPEDPDAVARQVVYTLGQLAKSLPQ